ncbi:MAG TPA: VWA domain-containing protein [Candidatus Binataceae bacterium]|nr:VWA domain-containing protein [Candidatus Binataceae bacterium]
MGFLFPGAFAFLALVPLLVLAYLARERPSRVTVSSVLAFRALRGFRKERFGGRPKFDWMFYAEALMLALAVLAMAGPFLIRTSNPVAVVIDNSAAMQARLPSGATRFEEALSKVQAALASESAGQVSIYVTAPAPHRIAPPFASVSQALRAIVRIPVTDSPNDYTAVTSLLQNLASGAEFRHVIFAGARPITPPVPARIRAIALSDPAPNLALGAFTLRREVFGASALHASLTVANFSPESRTVEVTISGDGARLASARESLSPGETASVEFPALPPKLVYRAELSPSDAFPLDNVAYATAGAVRTVSILFVSPAPGDAAGLDSIPGVAVKAVSPANFSLGDLRDIDLAIFEYGAPKEIPGVNSLLVMPPPGDPAFNFTVAPASELQVAEWRKTDPLTDSVNFRLLNLHAGEFIGQHSWMAAVVSGQGGALLLEGERQGHRYLATGFNPFPYLGRRNLPMSVLTLNMLSYLAGLGASTGGYHTGQPWLVPAGVESVILPSGRKVPASPGTLFTNVAAQGIYELVNGAGERTPRAVNLDNLTESDLENAPPLRVEPSNSPPSGQASTEKFSLSVWVLAAILALLALEAMIVYRRRRRVVLEA